MAPCRHPASLRRPPSSGDRHDRRGYFHRRRGAVPRESMITILTGLWFFKRFLWVSVGQGSTRNRARLALVARRCGKAIRRSFASRYPIARRFRSPEILADPGRRYFFRAATAAAGAAPFLGAMYGFAAERLNYQVRRVEIPLPTCRRPRRHEDRPDQRIHLSGYMTRTQVRRAVDMANDLGADLAVVTGDLITGMATLSPIALMRSVVCTHRSAFGAATAIMKFTRVWKRKRLIFTPGRHEAPAPREHPDHFQRRAVQSHRGGLPAGSARPAASGSKLSLTSSPSSAATCPIFFFRTIQTASIGPPNLALSFLSPATPTAARSGGNPRSSSQPARFITDYIAASTSARFSPRPSMNALPKAMASYR